MASLVEFVLICHDTLLPVKTATLTHRHTATIVYYMQMNKCNTFLQPTEKCYSYLYDRGSESKLGPGGKSGVVFLHT